MALFTKSAQAEVSHDDGIRVCIMRRPGEEIKWDIWMPHLAPSHELLTEYHAGTVDWAGFCDRFEKEVVGDNREYFDVLIDMASNRKVTLICWETEPEFCHRRLVAEECQKRDPNLEVTIL